MVKKITCTFLIIFILLFCKKKDYNGIPKIILKGNTIINLVEGEKYNEPGFEAKDKNDGDITSNVKIEGTIGETSGIYEITYSVLNSKKEKALAHRIIKVSKNDNLTYKDNYDDIDNTSRSWWSGNKFDYQRPAGGGDINELKKYNAFFLGPDKKIIYLTFDEGSLETYVKEIVDVLNKHNVKATFFLCEKYIRSNPDLIKKMVASGHCIGNHTHNHKNMPSLATKEGFNEYLGEIKDVEKAYFEITGKDIDKVYRQPRGEWSFRDLQIMKDLGYKSYFYSANYDDFSSILSKEKALNEMLKRYHNGAIYLIHPNNKGNYEAIESFIIEMKRQGFSFGLVKDIS